MKIRLVGGAVALVLAVLGTVGVLSYVQSANERALAGAETVDVLVVIQNIPQGTPAQQAADSMTIKAVPAKVVPEDHVSDAEDLRGQVAAVDLKAGEQVLGSRFADPDALAKAEGEAQVAVPQGTQQITIALEPQRVLGGRLRASDKVGVFLSWKGSDTGRTRQVLDRVLVTNVQGAPTASGSGDESSAVPEGSLLVTLAVNTPDAERIVWISEFGSVWLSKQPGAVEGKSKEWTQKEILQ